MTVFKIIIGVSIATHWIGLLHFSDQGVVLATSKRCLVGSVLRSLAGMLHYPLAHYCLVEGEEEEEGRRKRWGLRRKPSITFPLLS